MALPARVVDARVASASDPVMRKRGNSHTLDLLRGLAALGVVAFHFDGFSAAQGYSVPLHEIGTLGVQMFFVLSGYFIGSSVLAPRAFDSVDYGVNRLLRIVPNYVVSLVIAIVLLDSAAVLSREGWGDVATHLFFVQGWFFDYRVSISPVLWTLSVEWMFYLFMLAAAGLIRHRRGGWWIAFGMIAVAVVYRTVLWRQLEGDPQMLNFGYKQLPGTFDLFACGLLVALLLRQDVVRRWAARSGVKLVGLALSVVGLLAAAALYRDVSGREYYAHGEMMILFPLVFAVAAAGLILFFQQFEHRIGPALDRSRFAFIGVMSYSIYLYHLIVIQLVSRHTDADQRRWFYLPLMLLAIFAVSIASYLLIERPFMARRARVRERVHASLVVE
jgi:peptidoglycan/LPS O-acetylase OafA/YrhL